MVSINSEAAEGGTSSLYFFKGDRYVRYDIGEQKVADQGLIEEGFPGLKELGFDLDIDAAAIG